MSTRLRKRNRIEDSDESDSLPVRSSPKRKKRRRSLQSSQSDDDPDPKPKKKKKRKKSKKEKDSNGDSPRRTPSKPKALKLTTSKPRKKKQKLSPSQVLSPSTQSNVPSDTDSATKPKLETTQSDPPKAKPKKNKLKKTNSSSHDIRNFFSTSPSKQIVRECTAEQYFGSLSKKSKPNFANLSKQSKKAKALTAAESTHKSKKSKVAEQEKDSDSDIELPEHKPLPRRKKTPTPTPTPSASPKPKSIDCDDSKMSAAMKSTTTKLDKLSVASSTSKPMAKPKASRKRKLDEITSDANDNANDTLNSRSQSTSTTTNSSSRASSGEPAAKKKKWTPGFKRRDDPPLRGQTMIPMANPYCLSGMRFVITGQLPSLTRDEASDLIKQYGGRVTGSVSGMTRYLLAGDEAGESKLKKAADKKVSVISEADFLKMLGSLPAGKEPTTKPKTKRRPSSSTSRSTSQTPVDDGLSSPAKPGELFVDKYAPRTSAQLIGNAKCIADLRRHLLNFEHIASDAKAKKRGVLLSGQPGIGKTSAVKVIAKELGYDVVEFNASDTRSKKSLKAHMSQSLNNCRMTDFFGAKVKTSKSPAKAKRKSDRQKNVIVMDEVDGMSSGDRGGMQELVGYIKVSKVPIICICNDRNSPKVRTLANYCLDLRFRKPTAQQISRRLVDIARREGFMCDVPSIQKLAEGTNGDIRQILHLLQFWSNDESSGTNSRELSFSAVKARLGGAMKDATLGPWDVTPRLFSQNGYSIIDGLDLYFTDFSLIPLMVQENYLSTGNYLRRPVSEVHLRSMSEAALSIADGDLIDARIRASQQYAALPYHGVLSSIKPAKYAAQMGRLSGRIGFPAWMGKNSGRKKCQRLFGELAVSVSGSVGSGTVTSNDVALDLLEVLREMLVTPMGRSDGAERVGEVVEFMKEYGLSREDWDTLVTCGEFGRGGVKIATRVKSAFTRRCNKELSNVGGVAKKKGKGGGKADVNDLKLAGEEEVVESSEEQEGVEADGRIKMKKSKKKAVKKTTKRKRK